MCFQKCSWHYYWTILYFEKKIIMTNFQSNPNLGLKVLSASALYDDSLMIKYFELRSEPRSEWPTKPIYFFVSCYGSSLPLLSSRLALEIIMKLIKIRGGPISILVSLLVAYYPHYARWGGAPHFCGPEKNKWESECFIICTFPPVVPSSYCRFFKYHSINFLLLKKIEIFSFYLFLIVFNR